jgi:hypothetical protein
MTRADLEQAIVAAKSRAHELLLATLARTDASSHTAACAAYELAERGLGGLWRRLAEEHAVEAVVPLELGFEPAADVSGATVLQDEYDAFLLFNTSSRMTQAEGIAVIRFSPASTKFGLPNDEALDGHPLSSRGLRAYACGEVLNSSWLVEEQRRNAVRFPTYKLPCRHYIFTFHDSCLEILARELKAELRMTTEYAQIAAECMSRLGRLDE